MATLSENITQASMLINQYRTFIEGRAIQELIIPNGTTRIGEGVLDYSIVDNVIVPDSVISISDYAFNGSSLKSINIPNSVTSIGDYAFASTRLKNIIIPTSVVEIGESGFWQTPLTDIYYTGTQAQWEQITLGTDAIPSGVTIHYNYSPT